MAKTPQQKYDQYTKISYGGRMLLQNHALDKYGVWKIKGEDANAELAGSHHQPDLGMVEGKLEDAIRYAVCLDRFWTWGGGGDISFCVHVPHVTKKVPVVEEDEGAAFKKQVTEQMEDNPQGLFPNAIEMRDKIIAEQAEPLPLTYGMINKLKKALEGEILPDDRIIVRYSNEEMHRRRETVERTLLDAGYDNITICPFGDGQNMQVIFRIP